MGKLCQSPRSHSSFRSSHNFFRNELQIAIAGPARELNAFCLSRWMNYFLNPRVFTRLRLHLLVVRPHRSLPSASTPLTFRHPVHFVDVKLLDLRDQEAHA